MQRLPVEIFPLLFLAPEEILEKCRTSSYYRAICNSDIFWQQKYHRDYPNDILSDVSNWKELYWNRRKQEPCVKLLGDPIIPEWNQDMYYRRQHQGCINQVIEEGNLSLLKQYVNKGLFPQYLVRFEGVAVASSSKHRALFINRFI
jgi:hypothetical protein